MKITLKEAIQKLERMTNKKVVLKEENEVVSENISDYLKMNLKQLIKVSELIHSLGNNPSKYATQFKTSDLSGMKKFAVLAEKLFELRSEKRKELDAKPFLFKNGDKVSFSEDGYKSTGTISTYTDKYGTHASLKDDKGGSVSGISNYDALYIYNFKKIN